MVHGLVPNYLAQRTPPLVSTVNPYHRRNPLERVVPIFKNTLYEHSFFVSTTYLWNELPDNYKTTDSISSFKRLLRKDDIIVPLFYFGFNRTAEVIHCKLRLEISDLKGDLVRRHLADNPACQCGYQCEHSKYYLFDCPLFNDARSASIHKISNANYTLDCLLFGDQNLSTVENSEIFQYVSNYIILSKRFVQ